MPATSEVNLSTLKYIIVYVKDMDRALAFYRDTLGLKVKVESPEWSELETGATTIALQQEEGPEDKRGVQSVLVFYVDNITQTHHALQELGIRITREPQKVCEAGDRIGKSADFEDPDGNPLSIFSFVPKE